MKKQLVNMCLLIEIAYYGSDTMKLHRTFVRGCGITKNTVLTKQIMFGVVGWQYIGKSWVEFPIRGKITKWKYIAYNSKGERDTMKAADEFCLKMYKEFYESHPEEHDWLPDPYNRKKIVSKVIVVQED